MSSTRTTLLRLLTLLILAATLTWPGTASLAGKVASPANTASPAKTAQNDPPASPLPPREALSPRMLEIQAAVDEAAEQGEALRARLDAAISQDRASALQKELVDLKLATEIRLLQIQAKHALLAGKVEQAERIEMAIQRRLDPPPPPLREAQPDTDKSNTPRR